MIDDTGIGNRLLNRAAANMRRRLRGDEVGPGARIYVTIERDGEAPVIYRLDADIGVMEIEQDVEEIEPLFGAHKAYRTTGRWDTVFVAYAKDAPSRVDDADARCRCGTCA